MEKCVEYHEQCLVLLNHGIGIELLDLWGVVDLYYNTVVNCWRIVHASSRLEYGVRVGYEWLYCVFYLLSNMLALFQQGGPVLHQFVLLTLLRLLQSWLRTRMVIVQGEQEALLYFDIAFPTFGMQPAHLMQG